MSAEEDTFEIDIYGDDGAEDLSAPVADTNSLQNDIAVRGAASQPPSLPIERSTSQAPQQRDSATPSLKRKHDENQEQFNNHDSQQYHEDTRPVDPNATTALKLGELHWWTTEEDVREFCAMAQTENELFELSFGEHKINGKSKGEAYLEFESPQAATATKHEIEKASQIKDANGIKKSPFTVFFTPVGNPHKNAAASGAKKEWNNQSSSNGPYNSYTPRGRGSGFGGRGGFNNRGGYNNNMAQGRGNGQAGWNNANNMNGGNFGGFQMNPMMAQNFNSLAMQGFNNIARGGMMNGMGMMGRGGFNMGNMNMGGMNMGGMMGGGGRGGMMGTANGGFNNAGGGYGQQNGGAMGNGQQVNNKRPKME